MPNVRDARTVETTKRRMDRQLKEELKYYEVKICCMHGGAFVNLFVASTITLDTTFFYRPKKMETESCIVHIPRSDDTPAKLAHFDHIIRAHSLLVVL